MTEIEPALSAGEADVLSVNYIRVTPNVERGGVVLLIGAQCESCGHLPRVTN